MVGTMPDLRISRSAVINVSPAAKTVPTMIRSVGSLKYLRGRANAQAQICAFIGSTEKLVSTCDKKDSVLTARRSKRTKLIRGDGPEYSGGIEVAARSVVQRCGWPRNFIAVAE